MACYVDNMEALFGRMVMCHMWADTDAELLSMADQIGVARKWIQGHSTLSFGKHRDASWVHFDITKSKRALAVRYGAIETDRYGPLRHTSILALTSPDIDRVNRALKMLTTIEGFRNGRDNQQR